MLLHDTLIKSKIEVRKFIFTNNSEGIELIIDRYRSQEKHDAGSGMSFFRRETREKSQEVKPSYATSKPVLSDSLLQERLS